MNVYQRADYLQLCNLINSIPILGNKERVLKMIDMKLITLQQYRNAKTLFAVANEVYPDMCDLQLWPSRKMNSNRTYSYDFVIVIRFKELTVTNSKNQSMKIYDMFFAITIKGNSSSISIGDCVGNRFTFNTAEVLSRYKFSHLSRYDFDEPPSYTGFCFGDGDIPLLIAKFNQTSPVDLGLFRLFLFTIESYLSWESLEGGPYVQMSVVSKRSNLWNPDTTEHYVGAYGEKIIKRINEIDCDIIIKNGQYLISDNDRFRNSIVSVVVKHFSSDEKLNVLFSKGSDGKLYLISAEENMKPFLSTLPVMFQQREFRYTITDTNHEVNIDPTYYVNPKISSYVKSKLEYKLNQETLNAHFVRYLQDQVEI